PAVRLVDPRQRAAGALRAPRLQPGVTRRRRRMKGLRTLTALAAMAAGLPAFLAPAAADDSLKMTIGQRGNWDTAVCHLGIKAGIFKKQGLDLDLVYTSGSGETLQPVIAGAVDLGF